MADLRNHGARDMLRGWSELDDDLPHDFRVKICISPATSCIRFLAKCGNRSRPFAHYMHPHSTRRGYTRRSQAVEAIQAGGISASCSISSVNTSLGFLNPSIARGRSLSESAMAH